VEGFIGKWLEYALLFMMAADLGARQGIPRRVGVLVAWSSVLVVIEALSQELFGTGVFRGYRWIVFERMTGPYTNPIDLATYIMVVVPLLLGVAQGAARRVRWALWVLVAALIGCLGRTLAFGVWLSFGAALLWLAWRRPDLRRPVLVALGAVAAASLGFMALRGEWYLATLSDMGTKDRVYMWQAALRMIQARPVLGHGVNTFMANYLDYWVGGERQPRYAHNCYLQIAAETGLIGLAAFSAMIASAARRIWTALRGARADTALLAGLATGLLAFLIHAGYETNFFSMRQAALFWTLGGLALGMSQPVARAA
jgi:O-antigen ligase